MFWHEHQPSPLSFNWKRFCMSAALSVQQRSAAAGRKEVWHIRVMQITEVSHALPPKNFRLILSGSLSCGVCSSLCSTAIDMLCILDIQWQRWLLWRESQWSVVIPVIPAYFCANIQCLLIEWLYFPLNLPKLYSSLLLPFLRFFSSMTSVLSVLNFCGFLLSSGRLPCALISEDLLSTQNYTLKMDCPKWSNWVIFL